MNGHQPGYTATARALHWLVAALILCQVPLAYYMIDLPLGPDKLARYALHKSLGMSIFTLSALRLAWRWWHPPPPLPADTPRWQRRVAGLTHGLLYVITFAMPLTGWLSSSAANFPVSLFGLVTLPDLVAPDLALHERLELAHRLLAYTLFALFGGHLAAALWHHLVRRDRVLLNMLPWPAAPRRR